MFNEHCSYIIIIMCGDMFKVWIRFGIRFLFGFGFGISYGFMLG